MEMGRAVERRASSDGRKVEGALLGGAMLGCIFMRFSGHNKNGKADLDVSPTKLTNKI